MTHTTNSSVFLQSTDTVLGGFWKGKRTKSPGLTLQQKRANAEGEMQSREAVCCWKHILLGHEQQARERRGRGQHGNFGLVCLRKGEGDNPWSSSGLKKSEVKLVQTLDLETLSYLRQIQ